MLVNEILKDLSAEDLNQRYGSSYVSYRGKAAYVQGFGMEPGHDTYIQFAHLDNSNRKFEEFLIEPFNHTFLDTSRPPSRWYFTTSELRPFFLLYYRTRQWSRGITTRTVEMQTIDGRSSPKMNDVVFGLFNKDNMNVAWRNKLDVADVIKTTENILLSPFILVTREKNIYYRNKRVGQIRGNDIELTSNLFEQELSECISGATFRFNHTETKPGPSFRFTVPITRF